VDCEVRCRKYSELRLVDIDIENFDCAERDTRHLQLDNRNLVCVLVPKQVLEALMRKADVCQRTLVLGVVVCESGDVSGICKFDRQYNFPTYIPATNKKFREDITTWNK
jgi:hypothetical protein